MTDTYTTAELATIPNCDLPHPTPTVAFADADLGATHRNQWGYVCEEHFNEYGCTLGLGHGQQLVKIGETNSTAVRFFDQHIAGRNIMTPERIDVGWTADGEAWELSGGTDFDRRPMWGVTVLDGERTDSDRSLLFNGNGSTDQRWVAATDYVAEITGQQDGSGYRQNIGSGYGQA